mgnify:CR=1 FL=1
MPNKRAQKEFVKLAPDWLKEKPTEKMREEIKNSLYRYMIRKNISPENVKDMDISLWTLFNDVRNED